MGKSFRTFLNHSWKIALVLLLALVLRLPLLNGSFWLDEAAQALESARPLSQQLQIVDDFQPPLIHLLVHFTMTFSRAEWWLRTFAALIPGLITVWVTYQIGKKMGGERAGLVAAFLLATNSLHIFYSQELRPYSLAAMFAVLSWWMLLQWFDAKKNKKNAVLFALFTIGGFYSSYLYPFLFLAQVVYVFFWQRSHLKQFLVASFFACLAFLPWVPMFFAQLRAGQQLRVDLPGWENVVSFDQVKSLLLVYGKFVFGVIHLETNAVFVVASAILISSLLALSWVFLQRFGLKKTVGILVWFLFPIITAWLISFKIPVIQPKRVLFLLPAFYIWVAIVTQTAKKKWQVLSVFLIFFLVATNLFSTYEYYTQPRYQREDWRSLHEEITQHYSKSRSVALFSFTAPFSPWVWYDDGSFPTFSTGVLSMKNAPVDSQLKKITDYQYVLVFDYLRDLTDPENSILTTLNSYGYHEVDRITPQTPIGFVRVFAKKNATLSSAEK